MAAKDKKSASRRRRTPPDTYSGDQTAAETIALKLAELDRRIEAAERQEVAHREVTLRLNAKRDALADLAAALIDCGSLDKGVFLSILMRERDEGGESGAGP